GSCSVVAIGGLRKGIAPCSKTGSNRAKARSPKGNENSAAQGSLRPAAATKWRLTTPGKTGTSSTEDAPASVRAPFVLKNRVSAFGTPASALGTTSNGSHCT